MEQHPLAASRELAYKFSPTPLVILYLLTSAKACVSHESIPIFFFLYMVFVITIPIALLEAIEYFHYDSA